MVEEFIAPQDMELEPDHTILVALADKLKFKED
jgi:hypothetical protein